MLLVAAHACLPRTVLWPLQSGAPNGRMWPTAQVSEASPLSHRAGLVDDGACEPKGDICLLTPGLHPQRPLDLLAMARWMSHRNFAYEEVLAVLSSTRLARNAASRESPACGVHEQL